MMLGRQEQIIRKPDSLFLCCFLFYLFGVGLGLDLLHLVNKNCHAEGGLLVPEGNGTELLWCGSWS